MKNRVSFRFFRAKAFLMLCLLLASSQTKAQGLFVDNFNDGNFTTNPAWTGDAAKFIVNAAQNLQLNDVDGGSAQLRAAAPVGDSTTWELWLQLDFSPSTSNFVRVYLSASLENLTAPLNGYYLQIGETGSTDAIELYEQTGATAKRLLRGTDGAMGGSTATARIRVTRTPTGSWKLYADYSGGANLQLDAAANAPLVHPLGNYFGMVCTYTSTRSDKFFFDDIRIEPLYNDTQSPKLTTAVALTATQVQAIFNEAVSENSATMASNFSLSGGIGQPQVAARSAADPSVVLLDFAADLVSGTTYTLTANNIADLKGNVAAAQTALFTYYNVQSADRWEVIITEMLPDPTPTLGLPEAEYVELFNRSNKVIQLQDFEISNGSSRAGLPAFLLLPNAYVVIADEEFAPDFQQYANFIGVGSMPTLTNTGDEIFLFNADGDTLHRVQYDQSWYRSSAKSEGGWSLEMINPKNPCITSSENWSASAALAGGTPAAANSVLDTIIYITAAPQLVGVYLLDTNQLQLTFDQTLAPESLVADDFEWSPAVTVAAVQISENRATLTLAAPLEKRVLYELAWGGVRNCIGTFADTAYRVQLGIAEPAVTNDLVINEILFNPQSGGYDFVEVYNRSEKILDLSDFFIANVADGFPDEVVEIAVQRLVLPQTYVVLTENTLDVASRYLAADKGALVQTDLPTFVDAEGGAALLSDGAVIDLMVYNEEMHFVLIDDLNGVSLERLSTDAPSLSADNWHSAASTVGYATPGYKNSQQTPLVSPADNNVLTLSKTVFSPDNDGFEDALLIQYEAQNIGAVLTLDIYDINGRKVRNLSDGMLMPTAFTFQWDGATDDGTKARLGIYIIAAEIIETNGNTLFIKKECVVAGKL